MAIERNNVGGNTQTSDPDENLNSLKHILEHLTDLQSNSIIDDKQIQDQCNRVVRELVIINVPTSSNNIKEFQSYLIPVGQSLERIIRQSTNPEQIFIGCLQTLYCLLVTNDSPSAGSGIIFDVYDQHSIPKAIKLLIKNTANMGVDNDNDFKKVTQTLCTWVRTFSGLKNLSHCIIYFLDGLRDLQKFALLMEIADSVVERLCLSLIIPVVRPNSVKVLSHILCSAQSRTLFMKIVPRIPKVIQNIQNNLNSPNDLLIPADVQLIIDLITALVNRYGVYDLAFTEITSVLKDSKIKASENAATLLDVKTWLPPISRDPTIPIGLVNLGNTCYMNSVLQALFMTKELTHDILLMKLPSKIINFIQQLIALLLFSMRQELAPHDVLSQRPSSFRYGHQQDSFEYLGFLLDQLHEEEKRCLTAAAKNIDNANGKLLINGNIGNGNGNVSAEQMDVDDNNMLNHTSAIDSPPLTDESDDAINPDESKEVTITVQTMVQKLFGGRLSINYKCLNCTTQSTNIDNFFDLQLSFPHQQQNGDSITTSPLIDKTNYTVQSLLNSYFATEQMTNDDKYFCDKCKSLCDGERHITLEEAPSNLILVIKHFKYDRNYHVRRKLLHKVHLSSSLVVPSKDGSYRLKYKLYAVIVHCGMNIDSGHYYTFAVNSSDEWFKFNDSHISRSSFNDIKNLSSLNTPYILFYEFVNKEKISESEITTNQRDLETSTQIVTNEICRKRKAEQPCWDDLPLKLQEFVNHDNIIYADQFRNKHLNGNEMIKNYYNKHRKSDNDQDPTGGPCGGSIVEQSNGYIY